MALNLATLNLRGLRDPSKCTRLLGELKNLGVDVAAVQETNFTCGVDCRELESDFNVFSAYGSRISVGVSLLIGRSLDADVDVVFAGGRGRLVVADVAVKGFMFRLVAVLCTQYHCGEGFLFSSVGNVPGRHEAANVNGWLEFDP